MGDGHLAFADERYIAVQTSVPQEIQSLNRTRSRNRIVVIVEAESNSVFALVKVVGQIDRYGEVTSEVVGAMYTIYPHIGNIHCALNVEPPLLATHLVDLDGVTIPADALPLLTRIVLLVAWRVRQTHLLPIGAVKILSRIVGCCIGGNAE